MVKKGQLTAKEKSFVELYTAIGSTTYNNAMQSALNAGYAHNTAIKACNQIVDNSRVAKAIAEARVANKAGMIDSVQKIRDKHMQYMLEAEQSGDKALARLNLQDLGRTYAAYTDKAVIDNEFTLNIQRFSKVIESNAVDQATITPSPETTMLDKALDSPISGEAEQAGAKVGLSHQSPTSDSYEASAEAGQQDTDEE
jgi:hypothetical protein